MVQFVVVSVIRNQNENFCFYVATDITGVFLVIRFEIVIAHDAVIRAILQMKTLIQTFRIIGTIMVSLNLVGNVAAEKTQVINFPSGKMIQLDLRSGAELNVEVWHKQEVEISYHDKTQDLANYKIAIDEVISGIKISSSLGHSGSMQLKFNLKVPQQTQLCLFSSGGNIKVSGLSALATFSFDHKDHLPFKTYLTQEMLKKGYLAGTNLYASTAHTKDILDSYYTELNDVFLQVSSFVKGDKNVFDHLDGPVCHGGFKRLN